MTYVAYSKCCLLIISCLAVDFSLADRGEGSATKSESQRAEAVRQKLEALQEKQERVIMKLEAEAHAARSESSASAEVTAARQAVAEKVKSHIKTLKAEQALASQILETPESMPDLSYKSFKAAAKAIGARRQKIGQAIDRMIQHTGDMVKKSQDYQHFNQDYYDAVKKFEQGTMDKIQDSVHRDLQKELDDIEKTGWEKAYTEQMRGLVEKKDKSPAFQMVMSSGHEVPNEDKIENMNMGENPYIDMSGGAIDSGGISGNLLKFMEKWLNYKKTSPLPEDGSKNAGASTNYSGAYRTVTIPRGLPDFNATDITSGASAGSGSGASSLIQVLPNALELQKNSSHSSE